MTGHKLVVAFALPQKNIIVIDTSKMTTHPFSLAITLKHELAHLLLHHQIESKKLPKWFDEGIAQWVSGGIAEILMRRDDRILRKASLSGKLIPLDELTRIFPQEEIRLLLAYEESKNFIEYIEQEFGVNGLRQVLTHLKDGENIET
ncbi:MAG: peptidase MA family metallohydrolase, partial [Nitrospiria bacterium]